MRTVKRVRTASNWLATDKLHRLLFTWRCYASAVLALGLCPSVSVSVTSRCSTKTAKCRITQTTPHDTPGTSRVVAGTQSFKYQHKYQYLSLQYQYQYQYPCLKYKYKYQYFGSKYQYQYQYHCTTVPVIVVSIMLLRHIGSYKIWSQRQNITTYSRIYNNALQLTIDQTESDNHHTQINNLFSIFRQTVWQCTHYNYIVHLLLHFKKISFANIVSDILDL